jgi:GR25 family glycosyltransferase involved in LPS biosynthesis
MFWVIIFVIFVIFAYLLLLVSSKPSKIELDKIYYINLDRRPDRKQHILKQIYDEKIPHDKVKRFQAIDGKTYKFNPEEKKMFQDCNFRNDGNENLTMGNQLSHYYILKEMVENNYQYILILQDDVVFKKDFNTHLNKILDNFPEDAEIVNIGTHKYAVNAHFVPVELEDPEQNKAECQQDTDGFVCRWKDHINPCSLAYIVSLKGAKNLIKYFQDVGFKSATDHNYNEYLRGKNIFYGSKTVLCTGALMGSDIFDPQN